MNVTTCWDRSPVVEMMRDRESQAIPSSFLAKTLEPKWVLIYLSFPRWSMIRELQAIPSSFLAKTLYSNCVQIQSVISTVGQVVPIFWDDLSHGGDDGIRTHDPLLAGQVLSQLSYTPRLRFCCFSLWNLHFCEAKISLWRSQNFTAEGNFTLALPKFHCETKFRLVGPSGLEPP